MATLPSKSKFKQAASERNLHPRSYAWKGSATLVITNPHKTIWIFTAQAYFVILCGSCTPEHIC